MDELFALFEDIGLPYYRQGSLSDVNYPDSFFTFWNFDSNNELFYDNEEHHQVLHIWVYTYTKNAMQIYSIMDNFILQAKTRGIICDAPYDTKTDKPEFYGRVCLVKIIK